MSRETGKPGPPIPHLHTRRTATRPIWKNPSRWPPTWRQPPPDMLHNVLDQETRNPAETARNMLPGEQWDRLRNAAKEELQRKIQDPSPDA